MNQSYEVNVCFIIPTYNEATNIQPLLGQLTQLHPEPDTAFLIVDDKSPDGTADIVRKIAETDGRIHLLEGTKQGLGRAYIRGMTYALDELGSKSVVQIDADFSHNPKDARRLVDGLENGADVVIGSRYAVGGSIDEKWPVRRKLLSQWGNRLARSLAGIRGVHDCTAGFKAIRATALKRVNLDALRVKGYAFQLTLLHRLIHTGAKVIEIPIHFSEREHGETKLGLPDAVEFFVCLWKLQIINRLVFIKYCVIGLVGVIVNLGFFQLMLAFDWNQYIASPIAIELSIISNFLGNNYWTFSHRELTGRKRVRLALFNLVSLFTLSVGYASFVLLTMLFPTALPVLLQGVAIVPAVALNYIMSSRWVFRGSV